MLSEQGECAVILAHLCVEQAVGILASVGITAQSLNIIVGLGILHEAVVGINQLVGRSGLFHDDLCVRQSRCLVSHVKINLHEFFIGIKAVLLVVPEV